VTRRSSRSRRLGTVVALTAGAVLGGTVGAASSSALLVDRTSSTAGYSTRLACSGGTGYPAAVQAAHPSFAWRFDEAAAPPPATVADTSGNGDGGAVTGTGLVFGGPGLITCDTGAAVAMPGGTDGAVSETVPQPTSDTFTVIAWVRSASTGGGRVVGMGSDPSGPSTQNDRALLLAPDGRAVLFLQPLAGPVALVSPTPVNDGQPHMLAATVSSAGAALYVDGTLVASDPTVTSAEHYSGSGPTLPGFGFWRVGYDDVSAVPAAVQPTQAQLMGSVDEVAVWNSTALDAATVAGMFGRNHW
jgi:hypothetical protein